MAVQPNLTLTGGVPAGATPNLPFEESGTLLKTQALFFIGQAIAALGAIIGFLGLGEKTWINHLYVFLANNEAAPLISVTAWMVAGIVLFIRARNNKIKRVVAVATTSDSVGRVVGPISPVIAAAIDEAIARISSGVMEPSARLPSNRGFLSVGLLGPLILITALALMLAGCGQPLPPPSFPPAPPAQSVIDQAFKESTQKLIVAHEAYQTATTLVGIAVDSGAVTAQMAKTLKGLNDSAFDALEKGSAAVTVADRIYYSGKLQDAADAMLGLIGR